MARPQLEDTDHRAQGAELAPDLDLAQQRDGTRLPAPDRASARAAVSTRERELEAEVRQLRARLSALEFELVEVQARTNAAVGEWQERVYWLDRWHIDLNAIMRRPGADELRAVLRAIRAVYRVVRRAGRALERS